MLSEGNGVYPVGPAGGEATSPSCDRKPEDQVRALFYRHGRAWSPKTVAFIALVEAGAEEEAPGYRRLTIHRQAQDDFLA